MKKFGEKNINILFLREGKDSFSEVYPATLTEWYNLTGNFRGCDFEADQVLDDKLLDEISERDEVPTTQEEKDNMKYVILFW